MTEKDKDLFREIFETIYDVAAKKCVPDCAAVMKATVEVFKELRL